jgi:hypothetical protein
VTSRFVKKTRPFLSQKSPKIGLTKKDFSPQEVTDQNTEI